MRRVIDCMIDQGVDGICILANFSEQFLLGDEERATLTRLCLEHAAGRRPVIVTISHFSTRVAEARAREAAELGAAMLMMMPPYHGALAPRRRRGGLRALRPGRRCRRHPDHGAGRADVRRHAPGRLPRADGPRHRAGEALQDRDAAGRGQAQGADRRRRRRHRGPLRRRGGDHAPRRPRRRRHRHDDLGHPARPDRPRRRRLPRRTPRRGEGDLRRACSRSSTSRTASAAGAPARR